ncbi:dehydrogenase/reductase SDR family member 11 [Patella vulgata]|uniref:dehydrogenase/reductase SDR family member 11 n=1 Tax=Patella vulgata TaxID=6465 RepID=UPI00217F8FB0|nr:dehydrogenase/reductase SDR family member 11 [Patella vulgata]XP_050403646.1 dehydrogenase/reductase SDR family member 11 [Patella vulgata]
MERYEGRVALVTGASSRVGEATVKLLVTHGMKVAACARSFDKLKTLAESVSCERGEVLPIRCDLRKEEDIAAMFVEIKNKWGGVDVCINSAGLALDAPIIDGDSQQWKNMWEVNVMALCLCTQESVKSMRERGVDDGHVINLNSLSGHRVGRSHFYSATKYAVTSLTDGIRWELRGIKSHIRVTSISPGLIKSNFAKTMLGDEAAAEEVYASRQALQPEDIAKEIEFVLASPPHVQIHEIMVRPTEQEV